MLFKLSYRNVKRSIKDYSIYFLTLALGVCIFYIFNSLESQTIMMDLSQNKKSYVELISKTISAVSVFVSFVLGFLVIYANNFIIKRRNKEFGIYMTLGISKNKISFMLFYETLIIGILSLAVGIFIGTFLSQGLASVTASMFEVNMTKYKFVFSKESAFKSILYFGITFILVMLLNFKVLSKYNLIDLINSGKNNEKLKTNNLILSVFLFVISIICLSIAYKLILENQLINISNNKFKISIALGIVGTFLFFRALAGFLIKATQSSKNYYLKNLNAFTLRQLNSKINTHYISLSIICIMLFVAIGMSSSAISIKNAIEKTSKIQTPYDMTITKDVNDEKDVNDKDLNDSLKGLGMDINKYSDEFVNYNLYDSKVEFSSMFKDTNDNFLKQQMKILEKFNNPIMKLSSYNKLREMQGKEKVQIKEKEVVLLTDMNQLKPAIEEYIKENDNIRIDKEDFKICKNYECMPIETGVMGMNFVVFVIDDKYVENFNEIRNYVSLNYNGNKEDIENKIVNEFEHLEKDSKQYDELGISPYSRTMAFENNMGISSVFLYVGIYIGVVFLISSAAVLALSQLSGANESLGRYKVLKKLGVSTTMINKSIFIQVLLYFILPISLALVHSIFGIKVANNVVAIFGDYDTVGNNIFVIGTILLVYTVYFVMTYKNYKRIVNK